MTVRRVGCADMEKQKKYTNPVTVQVSLGQGCLFEG